MAFGIATALLAILFFGFILLTGLEHRRGKRFFEASRNRIDSAVSRAVTSVATREHRAAFFAHVLSFVSHIVHEIIHTILVSVRAFERMLTRVAKRLRARRVAAPVASEEEVIESRRDSLPG